MEALENVGKYVQNCSVCIVDFEQVNVSWVVPLLLTLNSTGFNTFSFFKFELVFSLLKNKNLFQVYKKSEIPVMKDFYCYF